MSNTTAEKKKKKTNQQKRKTQHKKKKKNPKKNQKQHGEYLSVKSLEPDSEKTEPEDKGGWEDGKGAEKIKSNA